MAARALLDGIDCESGNGSTRYYTSPPGSTFLAPLDVTLEEYGPHAQTNSTLSRGDVIEIQGPAASGKTQLLQFFALTTALPRTWEVALSVRGSSRAPRMEKIAIGGRQKCVAVLDCDGRFSVERTYHLIRSHLARRVQEHAATIPALYSAEASPEALHEETLSSLARMHVFAPTSSISLAATLLQLPLYIQKSCSEELLFVLIDNISAFYWQDRYQAEQDHAASNGKLRNQSSPMRRILVALNMIREKLGVVTVLTNWAFPMQGDRQPTEDSPFFRQHQLKPYPSPFLAAVDGSTIPLPELDLYHPLSQSNSAGFQITHHLTLHAPQIKPVSMNVGLENATKEEPFRAMDQQELGSRVYVRMPGVENGDLLGRWDLVIRNNVIDGL